MLLLDHFFSDPDACRASRALKKLSQHDVQNWALAGSLALETHCALLGHSPERRALNDVDFVTASFEDVPSTLGEDFVFRHVHPGDPPGKVMLQIIDPENALRIDVFRTFDSIVRRARGVAIGELALRLIAIEDLAARNVRILLSLAENVPVASKHARDFVRTENWADTRKLETAWEGHRCEHHPSDFREAKELAGELIRSHSHLLIEPRYSTDVKRVCPRCASTGEFPLANTQEIMSILGYC